MGMIDQIMDFNKVVRTTKVHYSYALYIEN